MERGVTNENNQFKWQDRLPDAPALLDIAKKLKVPDDYLSEISLTARGLIASLCERMDKGAMIFIDYGFGAGEYYHPQRTRGTLMCHYRHHSHDDPFYLPGLQDITAHVDFTAVAETAIDHGAHFLGYTSQAHFLFNNGVTDFLGEVSAGRREGLCAAFRTTAKTHQPGGNGRVIQGDRTGKRNGSTAGRIPARRSVAPPVVASAPAQRMSHIHSFAPAGNADASILILGSMPGKRSLEQNQYYAHPSNAFWKIMGELVGAHPNLPYEERLCALKASHIALWDVLKTCERDSSLDSDIQNETANNFSSFFKRHPHITHVFFNGAKAEQSFKKFVLGKQKLPPLEFHRLPSTSPAHAGLRYADKLRAWRVAINP